MSDLLTIPLAILGGGIWGSFLGVLAIRIPKHTSILFPGSRCDHCGTPLFPRDMVPFLSWLRLRGRCRSCQQQILPEIPLSEVLSALFFLLILWLSPSPLSGLRAVTLFSFALPLTLIDIRYHRLPRLLTMPCIGAGILLGGLSRGSHGLIEALAGSLAGLLPIALIAHFYPRGIGMGDAFWLSAIGSMTGAGALALVLLIASSSGIVATLIVYKIKSRKSDLSLVRMAMPFGPFLALGGLVTLLVPDLSHLFNAALMEILT